MNRDPIYARCNAPARWLALDGGFQACAKHKREQPKRAASGALIEWERFDWSGNYSTLEGGAVCDHLVEFND